MTNRHPIYGHSIVCRMLGLWKPPLQALSNQIIRLHPPCFKQNDKPVVKRPSIQCLLQNINHITALTALTSTIILNTREFIHIVSYFLLQHVTLLIYICGFRSAYTPRCGEVANCSKAKKKGLGDGQSSNWRVFYQGGWKKCYEGEGQVTQTSWDGPCTNLTECSGGFSPVWRPPPRGGCSSRRARSASGCAPATAPPSDSRQYAASAQSSFSASTPLKLKKGTIIGKSIWSISVAAFAH